MLRWAPAALFGAAHFVIHFTVPMLDLLLHGALVASILFGAKTNA